jgi:hypothetical protein
MPKRRTETDEVELHLRETDCKALDLHRDDYRLQAVVFTADGSAVVTNGQDSREVDRATAAGFRRWLAKRRIILGIHTAWLVLDSVHRVGFVFDPLSAAAELVEQWGDKFDPMKLFSKERQREPREL